MAKQARKEQYEEVTKALHTLAGRVILEHIEKVYGGSCVDPSPHMTYFNLGSRDVVEHLQDIKKLGDDQIYV